MREVKIAAVQMNSSWDIGQNIKKAEGFVGKAAQEGANIVLLPELFATPYFCQVENPEFYKLARTVEESELIRHFQNVAKKNNVVIPVSFYEKCNQAYFNTVAVVDADGTVLGIYRKSHIPTGPQYLEKMYFSPGDTGFKVWDTCFGKIGVGICWDQYSFEEARIMALLGAEMIFYPSAVAKDKYVENSSKHPWQNVMRGHAASNMMPVIAANHVGPEPVKSGRDFSELNFFGAAFIAEETGEIAAECDGTTESYAMAAFDLDFLANKRASYGLFRDRRPEFYTDILKKNVEVTGR